MTETTLISMSGPRNSQFVLTPWPDRHCMTRAGGAALMGGADRSGNMHRACALEVWRVLHRGTEPENG